jgi:hypothetical protein
MSNHEPHHDIDLEAILSAPPLPSLKAEVAVPDEAEAAVNASETGQTNEAPSYGVFHGDYHDFAMLVRVEPTNRLGEWEQALLSASVPDGMSVAVRKPTLVMFGICADIEFMAIEQAMDWLNGIAGQLDPPVTLRFNAQPSHEV